jgi:diacylglycerol kinase (ATP)
MESLHYSRAEDEIPFGSSALRIKVILNPQAGRGQGARRKQELTALLDAAIRAHGHAECDIIETQSAGRAAELARRAAADGVNIVAAAGGDGTLNEVVNGLVGTTSILGLLPLGTGNDFARCLGIGTDLKLAVDNLLGGMPHPIDVGRAGDRWFVNIAGCGFDALVAQRINEGFRFLKGATAYVAAVCDCLRTLKAADIRLTLDGQQLETRALMCSVANATSYGGGMLVAPDAKIDDGLFDICLLREAGRLEFLRAFPRVFKGTHVTHPKVTMLRAAVVAIESDPPLPILIDGEVAGATPVTFTLQKHGLQVLMPHCKPRV